MAEPWPVITFELTLAAQQRFSSLLPSNTQPMGNETVSKASVIPETFTSWIPELLAGPNIAQKNGYQFTAYGKRATYLKNTYANGSVDDLLKVIS